MAQAEITLPVEQSQPWFRRDWVIGTLLNPGRHLGEIVADTHRNWLTPLLLLSVAAVIEVLVIGSLPAAVGAVDPGVSGPAGPYQYYTPEQQAQLDQALAAMDTPFFRVYLPAGLALAGVWFKWLLLGATLHLALTMIGSRISMLSALNLLAWASLPLVLRGLVHLGFVLSTNQALVAPGVSGLVPAAQAGMLQFLGLAAESFDLYFLWQIVLLGIGAATLSENRHPKVWLTVSVVGLGFLLLVSLPGFLLLQLSDLTVVRPFLF